MAYTRYRRPARAYPADMFEVGDLNRSRQRLIILSTGRGDMHLSPEEATALAADLKQSAGKVRRFLRRKGIDEREAVKQ